MAQRLKRLPGMWKTWVRSLGGEDPLEKEMATHSSILAWKIPWRDLAYFLLWSTLIPFLSPHFVFLFSHSCHFLSPYLEDKSGSRFKLASQRPQLPTAAPQCSHTLCPFKQLANLQNSENQSKVENMDLSELTPFQEEDEKEKRELEEWLIYFVCF